MELQQKNTKKKIMSQMWKFMKLYLIYWRFYLEFSVALYVICHREMLEHLRSYELLIPAQLCSVFLLFLLVILLSIPLFAQLSLPLLITMSLLTNYSASYHNIATYSTNKQLFYFKALFWSHFSACFLYIEGKWWKTFMSWSGCCKVSFLMDAWNILFQIAARINPRVIKSVYVAITL